VCSVYINVNENVTKNNCAVYCVVYINVKENVTKSNCAVLCSVYKREGECHKE